MGPAPTGFAITDLSGPVQAAAQTESVLVTFHTVLVASRSPTGGSIAASMASRRSGRGASIIGTLLGYCTSNPVPRISCRLPIRDCSAQVLVEARLVRSTRSLLFQPAAQATGHHGQQLRMPCMLPPQRSMESPLRDACWTPPCLPVSETHRSVDLHQS